MTTMPEKQAPASANGRIRCPNCGNTMGEEYAGGLIGISLAIRGRKLRNLVIAGTLVSARCERCGHLWEPATPSPDPVNATNKQRGFVEEYLRCWNAT